MNKWLFFISFIYTALAIYLLISNPVGLWRGFLFFVLGSVWRGLAVGIIGMLIAWIWPDRED